VNPLLAKPEVLDHDWTHRLIEDEDVGALVHGLFGQDLTPGQEEIAKAIAFPMDTMPITGIGPRAWCKAPTRYGKTEAFANGLCVRFLIDPRPLTCKVIGPRETQASIFRDRVARNIVRQPLLADKLDVPGGRDIEAIKKERSKRKFTFTDGKELAVISAHGDSDRAMGQGAFITVKDEACLITREADAKISRMAGDAPDSEVYELFNPWHRDNTAADHSSDPSWRGIDISLDQAIKEGRLTVAWVETQRRELAPTMFQVLYDSVFPDQAEDQLIPWSWVVRSMRKGGWRPPAGEEEAWRKEAGADIAEGGMDKTVLAHGWKGPGRRLKVTRWQAWKFADTMATANLIHEELRDGNVPVSVDENGVGKGVVDRLREKGHPVLGFKGGRSPRSARFANAASEMLWNLRLAFEEERIELYDAPQALLSDLPKWRWFLRGDKTACEVRGGKQQGQSPDHGDATALLAYGEADPSQRSKSIPRRDPLRLG